MMAKICNFLSLSHSLHLQSYAAFFPLVAGVGVDFYDGFEQIAPTYL